MDWLLKLLFFVMLAPFFVGLAAHVATGMFLALLPWFIASAAIFGILAGVSAGLVLRRRLPPQ